MKHNSVALAATGFISAVAAFPALAEALARGELQGPASAHLEARQGVPDHPGFNAAKQYVSNTGGHAFVAPDLAGGDQRGPCPGIPTRSCPFFSVCLTLVFTSRSQCNGQPWLYST